MIGRAGGWALFFAIGLVCNVHAGQRPSVPMSENLYERLGADDFAPCRDVLQGYVATLTQLTAELTQASTEQRQYLLKSAIEKIETARDYLLVKKGCEYNIKFNSEPAARYAVFRTEREYVRQHFHLNEREHLDSKLKTLQSRYYFEKQGKQDQTDQPIRPMGALRAAVEHMRNTSGLSDFGFREFLRRLFAVHPNPTTHRYDWSYEFVGAVALSSFNVDDAIALLDIIGEIDSEAYNAFVSRLIMNPQNSDSALLSRYLILNRALLDPIVYHQTDNSEGKRIRRFTTALTMAIYRGRPDFPDPLGALDIAFLELLLKGRGEPEFPRLNEKDAIEALIGGLKEVIIHSQDRDMRLFLESTFNHYPSARYRHAVEEILKLRDRKHAAKLGFTPKDPEESNPESAGAMSALRTSERSRVKASEKRSQSSPPLKLDTTQGKTCQAAFAGNNQGAKIIPFRSNQPVTQRRH
jgi:hypothetical protein